MYTINEKHFSKVSVISFHVKKYHSSLVFGRKKKSVSLILTLGPNQKKSVDDILLKLILILIKQDKAHTRV